MLNTETANRKVLAVICFAVGSLALLVGNFQLSLAILATSLATLVGTGKLASPWGINAVAATALSSGRGAWIGQIFYILVYALPATIVWLLLGLLLSSLLGSMFGTVIAVLAALYAFGYGCAEIFGWPIRAPGFGWQVPSSWVRNKPRLWQFVVWGASLGPGIITRNPYAGMFLLPLLVALDPTLLTASLVGFFHGAARAVGVMSNQKYLELPGSDMLILSAQLRWRLYDGLMLLIVAGTITAYSLSKLI